MFRLNLVLVLKWIRFAKPSLLCRAYITSWSISCWRGSLFLSNAAFPVVLQVYFGKSDSWKYLIEFHIVGF